MKIRRTDRGPIAEWWWTIDRLMLTAILALAFAGLVLTLAASPHVAARLDQPEYHFVVRHLLFLGPALAFMLAVSLLGPRDVRRLCLAVFVGSVALMVAAILFGTPIKGASRWIAMGPLSVQPSEFAKPAFVVLAAWFFAEGTQKRDVPGHSIALALYVLFAALLVIQPDFGQTILVTLVWGTLFFMAGMSWLWIIAIGGLAAGGIATAYLTVAHVRERIDSFLYPGSSDTFQVDTAREAILNGGWLGQGPGEGTVKRILPDAHTDFIFAVAAEEFGIVFCIALVAVFCFVVLRALAGAIEQEDTFRRLAVAGLAVQVGTQAGINMAVNLGLAPAKGMTLPLVSYGGSSLISVALALGIVIGLTRRRPGARVPVAAHPLGVAA